MRRREDAVHRERLINSLMGPFVFVTYLEKS
jgi:hypothetical protein